MEVCETKTGFDGMNQFHHLEKIAVHITNFENNDEQISNGIFAITKLFESRGDSVSTNLSSSVPIPTTDNKDVSKCLTTDGNVTNKSFDLETTHSIPLIERPYDIVLEVYVDELEYLFRSIVGVNDIPKNLLEKLQVIDRNVTIETNGGGNQCNNEEKINVLDQVLSLLTNRGSVQGCDRKDSIGVKSLTQLAFRTKQNTNILDKLDGTMVTMEILKRLESGLVIKPWSINLHLCTSNEQLQHINPNEQCVRFTSSKLGGRTEFLHRLVHSHIRLQENLSMCNTTKKTIETARDSWKDTALKLEGCWEKEKSQLFHNFLLLYKAKNEQWKAQSQLIEKLENEVSLLKNGQLDDSDMNPRDKRKKLGNAKIEMEDCLQALPDDLNNSDLYPPELVAKLASGVRKKVATALSTETNDHSSRRKTKRKTESREDQMLDTSSSNEGNKMKPEPIGRKRKNKTTGAIEYYDADALLEDETLFPKNKKGIISLRERDSQINETISNGNEEKSLPKARNNDNSNKVDNDWKRRALQNLDDDSTDSSVVGTSKSVIRTKAKQKTVDSDTTTDGENDADSIDEKLHSDILAQLEALKDDKIRR